MKKLLILLLLLSLSCQNQPESAKKPLRIGLVTWIGYVPFYIAQERGIFEQNNIEVSLLRIEGDAERRAAIASGDLDGSALTLDAMIVLRSQDIPVKTVMAIDASQGGDGIVATNDIETIADLRGKQVAFPTGLPSHFFLYSVLTDAGLSMSDISPVVMDADKAGSAFIAGQVEVAVTWEPWLSKAEEAADGQILIDSGQRPSDIEDVLFMREEVIAERPGDIEALIKSWYEAVDYMRANPAEAAAIAAQTFGLTEDEVKALFPKVRFEGKEENNTAFGTAENPGFLYGLYDRISEAWMAEGVITKRDQPTDGLDPSFVRGIE